MYAKYLVRHGIKDNTVQFSLLLLDRDKEIGTQYFYKMPGRNLVQSFTEQNVTYGLGYKPIRKLSLSNTLTRNDTHEDLVRHLGEMDKRTTENRFHLTADMSMCLFNYFVVQDEVTRELITEVKQLIKTINKNLNLAHS